MNAPAAVTVARVAPHAGSSHPGQVRLRDGGDAITVRFGLRVVASANRSLLLNGRPRSWLKIPSALPDDTAPTASLGHLKAQAAPMHPRAKPEPLGSSPWPQEPRLRPPQS